MSFIGTHVDKVAEKDVYEIDKIIKKVVLDTGLKHVWTRLVANCGCVVPINNTTAGEAHEDKNASMIRRK